MILNMKKDYYGKPLDEWFNPYRLQLFGIAMLKKYGNDGMVTFTDFENNIGKPYIMAKWDNNESHHIRFLDPNGDGDFTVYNTRPMDAVVNDYVNQIIYAGEVAPFIDQLYGALGD